jgi:hypothetical protein
VEQSWAATHGAVGWAISFTLLHAAFQHFVISGVVSNYGIPKHHSSKIYFFTSLDFLSVECLFQAGP